VIVATNKYRVRRKAKAQDTVTQHRGFLVLIPTFDVCGVLVGNRDYLSLQKVSENGPTVVSVE
jgi:hypothetical protein